MGTTHILKVWQVTQEQKKKAKKSVPFSLVLAYFLTSLTHKILFSSYLILKAQTHCYSLLSDRSIFLQATKVFLIFPIIMFQ